MLYCGQEWLFAAVRVWVHSEYMAGFSNSWKMLVSRSYSLKADVMVLSVCRVAALMHYQGLGPFQSSLQKENSFLVHPVAHSHLLSCPQALRCILQCCKVLESLLPWMLILATSGRKTFPIFFPCCLDSSSSCWYSRGRSVVFPVNAHMVDILLLSYNLIY